MWKIFMKLDLKPFKTLFQQVMRLKKNTNVLNESFFFKFLKSEKGLQPSDDAQKERKGILFPNIPQLISKKIIEDFDKRMAEIDALYSFFCSV